MVTTAEPLPPPPQPLIYKHVRPYRAYKNLGYKKFAQLIQIGDETLIKEWETDPHQDQTLPHASQVLIWRCMHLDDYDPWQGEANMAKNYSSYTEKMGDQQTLFQDLSTFFDGIVGKPNYEIDRIALYFYAMQDPKLALVSASTAAKTDRPVTDDELERIVGSIVRNAATDYSDEEGLQSHAGNPGYRTIKRKFDGTPFAIIFVSANPAAEQRFFLAFFQNQNDLRTTFRKKMSELGLI